MKHFSLQRNTITQNLRIHLQKNEKKLVKSGNTFIEMATTNT